jgi:hypothetical protein
MSDIKNYFGTNEPLPASKTLRAGVLHCLYEHGNLRYIKTGDVEVIRMIYSAVRDEEWSTAPYSIANEKVDERDNSFKISYTALYNMDSILYKGEIEITGEADNTITFSFKGVAQSDFLRNRIGLCVLHPLKECKGQKCVITNPNGATEELVFPQLISPHQPFKNISQMQWQPGESVVAFLQFEGDVFETEDQRNWTDASYKTYSTPLDLPFPVKVKTGDAVEQRIMLKVEKARDEPVRDERRITIAVTENKFPFPKIGFGKSSLGKQLAEYEIKLLKSLPFDHYRVEIRFDEYWRTLLQEDIAEAKRLDTKLELIVFFSSVTSQPEELVEELENYVERVASILVLDVVSNTTSGELMQEAYPALKKILPNATIGAGTDSFFTDWNRDPLTDVSFEFVSYSINPQVHATDIRSIIENLEAQQDTVQKAKTITPGKAIYVSPVTLRPRTEGMNHDDKQASEFVAAWTLLSIRYLYGSSSLTYYETIGKSGLIDGDHASAVLNYLRELQKFKPVLIREVVANKPLYVDALVVENAQGALRSFVVNFTTEHQTILIFEMEIMVPPTAITIIDN